MADKSVRFRLFGDDVTATKALKGVGRAAERTSGKLSDVSKGISKASVKTVALAQAAKGLIGVASSLGPLAGAAAAAGAAVAAAAGPVVVSGLATAMAAGVGLGLIKVGALLLAENPQVKAGLKRFQERFVKIGEESAQPMQGPFLRVMDMLADRAERLQPKFRQIFAEVAPAIEPLARGIATMVERALPGLRDLADASREVLFKIADKLPEAGTKINGWLHQAADAARSLDERIAGLKAKWEAFQASVSAFSAGVNAVLAPVKEAFNGIMGWLQSPSETTGESKFQPILDGWAKMQPALEDIKTFVAETFDEMLPKLQEKLEQVAVIIGKAMEAFQVFWDTFGPLIKETITGLLDAISSVVEGVLDIIEGILDVFIGVFTGDWERAWEGVKKIFSGALTAIGGILQGGWVLIGGKVGAAIKLIKGKITTGFSSIVAFVKGIPGKLVGALAGLAGRFAEIGSNIISSMKNAITGKAGELVESVKSTIGGAVDAAKNMLGIQSPSKVFAQIGRFTAQGFIRGLRGSRNDVISTMNDLFDMVDKTGNKRARATALNARKRIFATALARDEVRERLKDARDNLRQLRDSYKAERKAQRDSALGSANISEGTSFGSIAFKLQQQVARTKAFANIIEKLRKQGLGPVALQQLIDAGPEAGMKAAQAILQQGKAGIAQVNKLQTQLGAEGSRLGVSSAESLYGAGIAAARGLIRGLESEEARLGRVMETLARRMVSTIKRELKIKSPSRVFAEVGEYTGQGLVDGLRASRKPVSAAAADLLSRAAVRPVAGRSGAPMAPTAAMAGNTVVVQVSGSFVGNEQQLARVVKSVLTTAAARGVA